VVAIMHCIEGKIYKFQEICAGRAAFEKAMLLACYAGFYLVKDFFIYN